METLASRRVILLGETHYVQEHQEFVVRLLRELHPRGLRFFAQEMSHAAGWAVDDYVRGRREDYPPHVRVLDHYWIEALREFNRDLPAEERIRFRYIDMNHDPSRFHYMLQMMARESDTTAIIACTLLVTRPGTPEYLEALQDLHDLVKREESLLREEIGPLWYGRLRESLEIEVRSAAIRTRWSDAERESIMIDLTTRLLEEARGTGAIAAVNVGMFHAQKERYMGTRQEWLGEYLARHPGLTGGEEGLYSLAFYGMEGEGLRSFRDTDPRPVPPALERREGNLSRVIAEVARSHRADRSSPEATTPAVFLDLSHPLFMRRMPIAFTHSPLRAVPGRQFDGYLVYPEISVLESIRREW
ncbi:MAG: hypothetical protein EA427_05335 [Spirochaetaceae bacterium]|nr:MAG: hypothetical protein EA427_05335 [Spirochaetaceae bacterium]